MKQALTDALPGPLFVRDSRQLCAGNGGRPLYLLGVKVLDGGVICSLMVTGANQRHHNEALVLNPSRDALSRVLRLTTAGKPSPRRED